MAEAVVVLLIKKIASVLGEEALKHGISLFCQEASQLWQVHEKLKEIQRELEVMKPFLHHANRWQGNRSSNSPLQAWVNNVRKTAYEAEDVVDEVSYLLSKRRRGGLTAFLDKARNVRPWHKVAHDLQRIEEELQHLSATRDRYGIDITNKTESSRDAGEVSKRVTEASRLMEEDDVVGIDRSKDTLIKWLVDEDEPHLRVSSVWGMGGVGKTTLVSQVFNCHEVKNKFQYRAWVSVSQTYQMEDLLRRVFKELVKEVKVMYPRDTSTMEYIELVQELKNFLRGKRYLVILDDIWDVAAWESIGRALIDDKCKSRIVITTRIFNVAQQATKEYCMELETFKEADAWALFCKKAFRGPHRSCPLELESCARKILEKCEGLPLAIVIVGSTLSLRDERTQEWERFYQGFSWELNDNPEQTLNPILYLSLKHLPYYLRNCLLYCSVFPEDAPIQRKMLIRLWVAEGLIEQRGQRTMEEVAEDNLNELAHRCMLQVVERNEFGRIKLCRLHDIIRNLLLSISQAEKLSMIYEGTGSTTAFDESGLGGIRLLSFHNEPKEDDIRSWHGKNLSRLRSLLLLYGNYNNDAQITMPLVASGWRLLRVLHLPNIPTEKLPREVFNLFNLRYLSLGGTKIKHISKKIKRLVNLEILDLHWTPVTRLPRGITELQKLRHLLVFDETWDEEEIRCDYPGFHCPGGIWNLKSLQTLSAVKADNALVRHLDNLTLLRTLGIAGVEHHHCRYLCTALTKMSKLSTLSILASTPNNSVEDEDRELAMLDLGDLSDPPPLLQKLDLVGQLKGSVLPTWFTSLKNLTILVLNNCRLREDQEPLASLHSLPHLASLVLARDAYIGWRLCFREGWFLKLDKLDIDSLSQTSMVEIEEGALPNLRELSLGRCPEMKEIPQGIQHLTALQQLLLYMMPDDSIKSLEGQLDRVHHVPLLRHAFIGADGEWCERDLRENI